MRVLVLTLGFISCLILCPCLANVTQSANVSDTNQDMYVIHAMVYQVGILTNRTDDETSNMNTTGSQETVTFYHNNGSMVDLTRLADPLLTNVTAQSIVAVAPVAGAPTNTTYGLPWTSFSHLAESSSLPEKAPAQPMIPESAPMSDLIQTHAVLGNPTNQHYKMFKREALKSGTPVTIVQGSAVIPEAVGVHSLAIPSLLTLNNNFSDIPVPIPNISVVHYAKINTLVTKP